jgi:hypothetical protein
MLTSDVDAWTVVHDHGWRDGLEIDLKRETSPVAIVVVVEINKQR